VSEGPTAGEAPTAPGIPEIPPEPEVVGVPVAPASAPSAVMDEPMEAPMDEIFVPAPAPVPFGGEMPLMVPGDSSPPPPLPPLSPPLPLRPLTHPLRGQPRSPPPCPSRSSLRPSSVSRPPRDVPVAPPSPPPSDEVAPTPAPIPLFSGVPGPAPTPADLQL